MKKVMTPQLLPSNVALQDASVRKYVSPDVKEGQYFVFTTSKPLPYDASVTITVGPNVRTYLWDL